MQAIITKFIGPTDKLPARVEAQAYAGRAIWFWKPGLEPIENHYKAAHKLASGFNWLDDGSKLIGGGMPDGSGYAFVMVKP